MCSGILRGQSVYRCIRYRCFWAYILLLPGGAQQPSQHRPLIRDRNRQDFAPSGLEAQSSRSGLLLSLIHPSAWKVNSANFALTHIPHRQTSTSAITCSCLQHVSAVLSHFWAIRAYLEKCSIDKKSAVSTDHCACLAGAHTSETEHSR